jgi:small subunit ribosomal protein S20
MCESCQVLKRRIVGALAVRAKGTILNIRFAALLGDAGCAAYIVLSLPIHKRVYLNSLFRRTQTPCTNALPPTLTPCKADVRNDELILGGILLTVHTSAIKRHRQSLKARERNSEIKSRIRSLIKKARQAIESKSGDNTTLQIQAVNKALGKAVSKGIIKNNTASRWLSRLSRSAARN